MKFGAWCSGDGDCGHAVCVLVGWLLAHHFLRYFANKYLKKGIKGFFDEAEKAMMSYDWPGNVRELRNIIERCVVLEEMKQ